MTVDERRAALLLRYSEFVVQTEEQFLELARAIRASDEAAGMVLVPREPTQKMRQAAHNRVDSFDFDFDGHQEDIGVAAYRAMIAATEAE